VRVVDDRPEIAAAADRVVRLDAGAGR